METIGTIIEIPGGSHDALTKAASSAALGRSARKPWIGVQKGLSTWRIMGLSKYGYKYPKWGYK